MIQSKKRTGERTDRLKLYGLVSLPKVGNPGYIVTDPDENGCKYPVYQWIFCYPAQQGGKTQIKVTGRFD